MQKLGNRPSCVFKKSLLLFTSKTPINKMDKVDDKSNTCVASEKDENLIANKEQSNSFDVKNWLCSDLNVFLESVDLKRLDDKEICIHKKHQEALKNMKETYKDPETGYKVFTRLAHLKRGKCCGNACRHVG
uniref:Uncharacterized protein n=1 Tax=Biomphalaria glabrata TaxID=6526 RepID=A0A2C9M0V3_BIOGL